jgi:uncharacterized protein (TIGR00369 family)
MTTKQRDPTEQASFEKRLRHLFDHAIVFNRIIGLTVLDLTTEKPSAKFEMRPDLIGHALYGRLHGGVVSTVLDSTGGLAIMVAIANRHPDESADQVMQRFGRMGTIDMRTDFLQQGIGQSFIASAHVTRLGGRLASVQMALHNELGSLIATGAASYVIS